MSYELVPVARSSHSEPAVAEVIPLTQRRRKVVAVGGGKGGVGKSTLAANLAVAYGSVSSTVAMDGDLGMADLNLLLGQAPEFSLLDVLRGMPANEALIATHGIHYLPALNGSFQLANLDERLERGLLRQIARLSQEFETVVIDTAAGIDRTTVELMSLATDCVVVATPDPLSLADAYACLKVLSVRQGRQRAYLVPNNVGSEDDARLVVDQLSRLVDRFLPLELVSLPAIPRDPWVAMAAAEGTPLVELRPDAPAARAIRRVARTLDALTASDEFGPSARARLNDLAKDVKEA